MISPPAQLAELLTRAAEVKALFAQADGSSSRLLRSYQWLLVGAGTVSGDPALLADLRRQLVSCLADLRAHRQRLALKPLKLEAIWLETASLCEQQNDLQLALEVLLGLVRYLAKGERSQTEAGAADSLRAHACLRAAGITRRLGQHTVCSEILELCQNIRVCCGLRPESPRLDDKAIMVPSAPSPQKLLEWLLHLVGSLPQHCPAKMALDCWSQALAALQEHADAGTDVYLKAAGLLRSQVALGKEDKASLFWKLLSCCPKDPLQTSHQHSSDWMVVIEEAALADAESFEERVNSSEAEGLQRNKDKCIYQSVRSACLDMLRVYHCLHNPLSPASERADLVGQACEELSTFLASAARGHALQRLLRAAELLRRCSARQVPGRQEKGCAAEPLVLLRLGELFIACIRVAERCEPMRAISACASPLRPVSSAGRDGGESRQYRLLFLTGACELLCLASRADNSRAAELLSACVMRAKSPTELATTLQLVGLHLQKDGSNTASTRAMVKTLCMALGAAARRNTLLRGSREEGILLKAMAAAMHPVVARLKHGIVPKCLDESNFDWPSSILRQLSAAASGHASESPFPAALQSLIVHLVQAKYAMLEAWLQSNPELNGFKASTVFQAARERLVTQFTTIVQGSSSASTHVPKVQGSIPLLVLLRIGGLCSEWETEATNSPTFWILVLKAVDQLKMKLGPCSPTSAVFSLCQLDIFYHIFRNFDALNSNVAPFVDAFARLVLSLCQSGEMMTALAAQGDAKDERPLLLRAALCQLKKASAVVEDPLLLGRLKLLQAQCSLQLGSLEGVDEGDDPEPFAQDALTAWRQHFGLQAFVNVTKSPPAQVASALSDISTATPPGKKEGGQSRLCPALLRELLDAVHLFELLDMHALAAEVLAMSLACVTAGTTVRPDWWMLHGYDLAPVDQQVWSTMQASVIMLYRLAGALSRTMSDVSADWWQVAESARALLDGHDHASLPGFEADLEAQRLSALSALHCASITVQVSETGPAALAAASKVLEQSSQKVDSQQLLTHGLITAEVLWGLAEWSMTWANHRLDQRPGGSSLTAQCAALRSLTILLTGSKLAPAKQLPKQRNFKQAEEGVLHWPLLRSFLLQLRVTHQIGLLYERLGEPRLADVCFQGGMQLMARKLCGDRRWKLRFLCGRARLAVAGFPSPAMWFGHTVQAAPLASRSVEEVLEGVKDMWNQKLHGQPRLVFSSEPDSSSLVPEVREDRASMPHELLDLWLSLTLRKGNVGSPASRELIFCLQERAGPSDLRSANALLQLLSKQSEACDERWVEVAVQLVWAASESMVPHFLGRGLLAAAEGTFRTLQSAAIAPQRPTLRAAMRLGISALGQRRFIKNEAKRICDALKSLLSGQAELCFEVSLLLAAAALHCGLQTGDALTTRSAAQMLTMLANWTLKSSTHEVLIREPQAAMHLAVSTAAKLRRGKTWCLPRAAASAATLDSLEKAKLHPEERSRSPSKHRQAHSDIDLRHEVWELCKRVVPLCSGVSMLFLQELRSMQRVVESFSENEINSNLLALPHLSCKADSHDGGPALSLDHICDGSWLSQVPSDISVAWVQTDPAGQALQVTRSCPLGHHAVITRRVELKPGLLQSLQEEFRTILSSHGSKCREISKRSAVDKKSEANKLEFWSSCKRFDDQLGCLARRIQQEMLGGWRCLLAPWPQGVEAQQKLVSSLEAWMDEEAKAGFAEVGLPQRPADVELGGDLKPPNRNGSSCCSLVPTSCCCTSRFWLLMLLFQEAEALDSSEIANVLAFGVLSSNPSSRKLHRLASSLKRHRQEASVKLVASIPAEVESPLLLFVDSVTAQLPLEACPCLQRRPLVRGLAPNVALCGLARFKTKRPSSGFYVIDPSENCSNINGVGKLLAGSHSSSSSCCWQGRIGRPVPESAEVLEQLCSTDAFVFLGHGECARRLLRQEQLQLGALGATQATTPFAGACGGSGKRRGSQGTVRSVLMLMGCSSVKMDGTQFQQAQGSWPGEFESFGMATSALLGGAPLVMGTQWDVLGGDLDKLGYQLLQGWLGQTERRLLCSLAASRRCCLLPYLTGSAMVCYGIPM